MEKAASVVSNKFFDKFFDRWALLHSENDDDVPTLQMKFDPTDGHLYFRCGKCHAPMKFVKARSIGSLDKHCATQRHKGESRADIMYQDAARHMGL